MNRHITFIIIGVALVVNPVTADGADMEGDLVVYGRVTRIDHLNEVSPLPAAADEELQNLEPRVYGTLTAGSTRNLLVGFPLALRSVWQSPSCHALFETFAVSGTDSIATTLYTPPTMSEERQFCTGGVAAFTQVGSQVTRLCRGFGDLDRRTAAMIILHEALHHAGMPESPSTADAMSSEEINELVRSACGL